MTKIFSVCLLSLIPRSMIDWGIITYFFFFRKITYTNSQDYCCSHHCFAITACQQSTTHYRRTRGIRLMGLSPFWEKVCFTYDEYFYFYFIPTWRVISTTLSGFLFTRQFRRYAILRVKPSAYRIPFFRTSSWWLWFVVGGRVVVCGLWLCVVR